jgi:hypothetical protein
MINDWQLPSISSGRVALAWLRNGTRPVVIAMTNALEQTVRAFNIKKRPRVSFQGINTVWEHWRIDVLPNRVCLCRHAHP